LAAAPEELAKDAHSSRNINLGAGRFTRLVTPAWYRFIIQRIRGAMDSPALSFKAVRERAILFREELERVKEETAPPDQWYPYGILSNFEHLESMLAETTPNFFEMIPGSNVADIGGADGDLAFFLESLGAGSVDFIDYAATNWNGMRGVGRLRTSLSSRVNIHEVDLDSQFRLSREDYSIIFFFGILYHLKNPFYALEALAKASRHLLLSTRVTRFGHDRTTDISKIPVAYLLDSDEANGDATNFWVFSETGLRRILSRAGWDIEAYMSIGDTVHSDPSSPEGDERAFCLLRSRYS
jgi:tRNA (mo5U34)-methyltransferase